MASGPESPAAAEPVLDNSLAREWVVQKFGGTSVGKFPDNIARDIVKASLASHKVVVVSSARSTGRKVEGTTSRLIAVYDKLRLLSLTKGSGSDSPVDILSDAKDLIGEICSDHTRASEAFVSNVELRELLVRDIERECQELVEYIVAAKRFSLEINSRAKDRVVSFGEKLSCRFLAYLLRDYGVDSEYVDLSDVLVSDGPPHLDHAFYKAAAEAFRGRILACGNRVPVVTGFFGNIPGSLIDGDVGRGYTDLCAALCAVGLGATELQVWKEVDGIFTADPSKVPTARLLPSITPSEAAELTFYGSEVIHHLTMDQVVRAVPPIPIRIKNVRNPRGSGTIVLPDPDLAPGHQIERPAAAGEAAAAEPGAPPGDGAVAASRKPKRPTAVTIKENIAVINVHSNKRSISHGFFAGIFSILNQHRISVDLVSTSEVHVSMAVHYTSSRASVLERARAELAECGDVSVLYGMAILSLVGAEMKNMIGIAGRMFSTLGNHNINIEMISQGASEINISCVIEGRDATRAMNVLHTNLFTFLE